MVRERPDAEKADEPCLGCGHDRVFKKPVGIQCTRCKGMVNKV